MNKRQLSMLAALLAVGCAHRSQSEAHTARAGAEPNGVETYTDKEVPGKRAARSDDTDKRADAPHRANADTPERVDVPQRRGDRGRLAQTGSALPDAKRSGDEATRSETYGAPADNTRVNERDREASTLTPLDQGESQGDRDLTARIRKAVVSDGALSFSAKNVKIITRDGQVTLRGPVKSDQERAAIERIARELAGKGHVNNELEIAQ